MTDRIYNLKRDAEDLRDQHFCAAVKVVAALPPHADLRSTMPPVYDQGKIGCCVAESTGKGFREWLARKVGNWVPLSALDLYYQARLAEGTVAEDTGATIRDAMKVLAKRGVCPDADWPLVPAKFAVKPPAKADTDAAKYKITSYARVASLLMLKAALAVGTPAVIGIEVYPSLESAAVAKNGKVPMPKRGETLLGGHAVLAVGYDDAKRVVILRNSWGSRWGDKGYGYLPYGFWDKGYVFDMWTGE
jgi:C1A family cysteine protease